MQSSPDDRFNLPTVDPEPLEQEERGICYLGRIPTGMNSCDIRRAMHTFSVERIHLNLRKSYNNSISKKQTKRGGKRRTKIFKDGYIEFGSKAEAIRAAQILNGNMIGLGKKSSRTYFEIWCLRYKPGLTWDVLVDKAVGKRKAKEKKIKAEFAKLEKKHDYISGRRFKSQKMLASLRRKAKRELKNEKKWIQPDPNQILEGKIDAKEIYKSNQKLIAEKILLKTEQQRKSS